MALGDLGQRGSGNPLDCSLDVVLVVRCDLRQLQQGYGSLGAAIGFMVWLWISAVIVLLGGELNAEMEHQTSRDTTQGRARPLGSRGAMMADHVGEAQG
jgi:hypothetical protein